MRPRRGLGSSCQAPWPGMEGGVIVGGGGGVVSCECVEKGRVSSLSMVRMCVMVGGMMEAGLCFASLEVGSN